MFSIIALFLALGTGMLIGTVISDHQVFTEKEIAIVSQLEREFLNLKAKQQRAEARAEELRKELQVQAELTETLAPLAIKDRLVGRRVAVISLGAAGPADLVEEVLRQAGAEPLTGGKLNPSDPDGSRQPFDSIVFLASAKSETTRIEEAWGGYLKLCGEGVICVGAETSGTPGSLHGFFNRYGISSVDNLDYPAGAVALVVLLNGASGQYGVKKGAQSLLPTLVSPLKDTLQGMTPQKGVIER